MYQEPILPAVVSPCKLSAQSHIQTANRSTRQHAAHDLAASSQIRCLGDHRARVRKRVVGVQLLAGQHGPPDRVGRAAKELDGELGRPKGLSAWLAALQQGLPFAAIGEQFLSSDEFFAKAKG